MSSLSDKARLVLSPIVEHGTPIIFTLLSHAHKKNIVMQINSVNWASAVYAHHETKTTCHPFLFYSLCSSNVTHYSNLLCHHTHNIIHRIPKVYCSAIWGKNKSAMHVYSQSWQVCAEHAAGTEFVHIRSEYIFICGTCQTIFSHSLIASEDYARRSLVIYLFC